MHVFFLIITHSATLTYLKSETPEVPFDTSQKKTLLTPTRLRKQLEGVSSHLQPSVSVSQSPAAVDPLSSRHITILSLVKKKKQSKEKKILLLLLLLLRCICKCHTTPVVVVFLICSGWVGSGGM